MNYMGIARLLKSELKAVRWVRLLDPMITEG